MQDIQELTARFTIRNERLVLQADARLPVGDSPRLIGDVHWKSRCSIRNAYEIQLDFRLSRAG
jgi:hypothetical protein